MNGIDFYLGRFMFSLRLARFLVRLFTRHLQSSIVCAKPLLYPSFSPFIALLGRELHGGAGFLLDFPVFTGPARGKDGLSCECANAAE